MGKVDHPDVYQSLLSLLSFFFCDSIAATTFLAQGISFMKYNFPWTRGRGEWFQDDSSVLLYCELYFHYYITL